MQALAVQLYHHPPSFLQVAAVAVDPVNQGLHKEDFSNDINSGTLDNTSSLAKLVN
jgi:hypothetical protein